MLKGINSLLNALVLYALQAMGHGDDLIIAGANFPAKSIATKTVLGKVIKIDTEKNTKLSDALRVRVLPTLMIYKLGEMVWRQSGEQDANTLISLMKDHLN